MLTTTSAPSSWSHNRFHDSNDQTADTQLLRSLHVAMDRAVLDAYGWTDRHPVAEFFPEHEDDGGDEEAGSNRRKKYRYRWPDVIRDVAARTSSTPRLNDGRSGHRAFASPVDPLLIVRRSFGLMLPGER